MIAETLRRALAAAKAGRVAEARQAIEELEPYADRIDELRIALGMLHFLTGDAQVSARMLAGVDVRAVASMDCVEDFFGGPDLQHYTVPLAGKRSWTGSALALAAGDLASYGRLALQETEAFPPFVPGAHRLRLRSGKELALWRGEHVPRLVLLLADGFGDHFLNGRYIRELRSRADALVCVMHRKVIPLARHCVDVPLVAQEECSEVLNAADAYAYEWLMPANCGGHGEACWITPAPERVAAFRRHGEGLRVGICWGGSRTNTFDACRSAEPADLEPLLGVPSVRWTSLQVGPKAAQCPPAFEQHELRDFHDTAALVANLDLVISVDTAVANLACAMGKPLWLLGEHDLEWRWCGEGDRTPWFPSARVFRQERPGEWAPVLERVAEQLG